MESIHALPVAYPVKVSCCRSALLTSRKSFGYDTSKVGFAWACRFGQRVYTGAEEIFATLTSIRGMMMAGEPSQSQGTGSSAAKTEKLVHTIDNLECCWKGKKGILIRVSGSLVVGATLFHQVCRQIVFLIIYIFWSLVFYSTEARVK